MDPILIALLGLLGMFVLISLHVPVGVALAVTGIIVFAVIVGVEQAVSLVGTEFAAALSSMDFAIIPLFLLMGSFASAAGLSGDLYRLASVFLGHRRGGLAVATVGGCAAFGAVCGSSLATVATMSRIALPEMQARGYTADLASGSIAASGTLGMLIPPSIIIVLYALLTELDARTLLIAAVIPGIIAVLFHIVAVLIYVRLVPNSGPADRRASWSERAQTGKNSWAVITLGLLVSGGIYGGIFTVTEAAAVGAVLAFIFCAARNKLNRTAVSGVMRETASNTGMVYLMLIGASILSYFLAVSHMPETVVDWIRTSGLPPFAVILALYVMYLILGSIFETVAAMVVTLPFVLPMIVGMGYDPVWWGVMMVTIIGTGMITPPVGMNVFVLHGIRKDIPLRTMFKGVLPFFISDLLRLALLTFFPQITLWLPGVLA